MFKFDIRFAAFVSFLVAAKKLMATQINLVKTGLARSVADPGFS